MTTGAIILGIVSAIAVSDMGIGLYLRSAADRVELGDPVPSSMDPPGARRAAAILIAGAPVMWFIAALISFGVIPTGIDPIKF